MAAQNNMLENNSAGVALFKQLAYDNVVRVQR